VRKVYAMLIENTKRDHWEGFLESLDQKSVWAAHRYASGDPTDGGRARITPLRSGQEGGDMQTPQVPEMNEDKSRLLCTTFFPDIEREDMSQADESYPTPKFTFTPITDDQIYRMINRLGPYKALGPDGIPNAMLIRNADLIVLYLGPLYQATFKLGIYPDNWRESTTVVC